MKLEFSAKFPWLCEEQNRKKAPNFTAVHKAFILNQAQQDMLVAEICRTAGISLATFFNEPKTYGGLPPNEMRRLKAIEDGNTRLKKIVVDFALDREMPRNVIG